MLAKKYRVTAEKEFAQIYANGIKSRGKYGMLIFLPDSKNRAQTNLKTIIETAPDSTSTSPYRFGFVINNKVGKAVKRHLFRRWLRNIIWEQIKSETFAETKGIFSYIAFEMPDSYDSVKQDFNKLLSQFNLKS